MQHHNSAGPKPPCFNPLNPSFETPCFSTLYTNKSASLSVRQYGVLPNVVSVQAAQEEDETFEQAVGSAAYFIFCYFAGDNEGSVNLTNGRTVPLMVRPPAPQRGDSWIVDDAVATSAYPNPDALPSPLTPEAVLTPFTRTTIAARPASKGTLPDEDDFKACGAELVAALEGTPFRAVADGVWSPTYALYYTRDALPPYAYECWTEVASRAAGEPAD